MHLWRCTTAVGPNFGAVGKASFESCKREPLDVAPHDLDVLFRGDGHLWERPAISRQPLVPKPGYRLELGVAPIAVLEVADDNYSAWYVWCLQRNHFR
jgi:hypothetical protein